MKKSIFVALLLLCIAVLYGCEKGSSAPTRVSDYKSKGAYTDLGDEVLSWEGIDKLPKKYPGMSTQEARQTVVDFWHYCKKALWIPDDQYDIYKMEDDVRVYKRSAYQGSIYAGLPYVGKATGNIYRLLDFMDHDTGVVDISEVGKNPMTFGGMCSSGCYWAWARVLNSADYLWCRDSVVSRGYLRVGPYTYDDSIPYFIEEGDVGTDNICQANGEQIMYQSYAAMDIADGFITLWEKNGHTMMCTVAPHVEYAEDGTIDGRKSFLCITEQGGRWDPGVSEKGIAYEYAYSLDKKFTFRTLYEQCYIPYTFADLTGADPIEETEISYSHTAESITKKELLKSKVTSNYHISDLYATIYDKKGNEVLKHVVRVRIPSTMEKEFNNIVDMTYTWGDWDDLKPGGKYTVRVDVQLGTGERPTVYEGKFVVE